MTHHAETEFGYLSAVVAADWVDGFRSMSSLLQEQRPDHDRSPVQLLWFED